MFQTKILREKIEIDLATRRIFQIERIFFALLLAIRRRISRTSLRKFGGGGIVNIFRSAASTSVASDASPAMTQARVKAICSHVSASVF